LVEKTFTFEKESGKRFEQSDSVPDDDWSMSRRVAVTRVVERTSCKARALLERDGYSTDAVGLVFVGVA
jgi:hypothetical protein